MKEEFILKVTPVVETLRKLKNRLNILNQFSPTKHIIDLRNTVDDAIQKTKIYTIQLKLGYFDEEENRHSYYRVEYYSNPDEWNDRCKFLYSLIDSNYVTKFRR